MIGLPYLEKQKSGQWMATLHQTKFMGLSIISITKSGRPNSIVDIQEQASNNREKRGDLQKNKKKRSSLISQLDWCHYQAANSKNPAVRQVLTFFFFFFLEITPFFEMFRV